MSLLAWDPAIHTLRKRYQEEGLSEAVCQKFQQQMLQYYANYGRNFPWRQTKDPYAVLASETMLQQTQTHRVVSKYNEFMKRFPDIASLAKAALKDVLAAWQGLGYNRRAKLLQQAAQQIVDQWNGHIPEQREHLEVLPGVGPYTATAVRVFAFNQPDVVLETNIRTVYIFFFLSEEEQVTDAQLQPFVERTLYYQSPRTWYNALMDYGAMLKLTVGNLNKRSEAYTKQSQFEGSNRQARGRILHVLTQQSKLSVETLQERAAIEEPRFSKALQQLQQEGLVMSTERGKVQLAE